MIDLLRLGIKYLKREKIRSLLTITGIVIAVATLFSLISISEGTNRFIEYQFSKIGADKIIIIPGGTETSIATAFTGRPFTEKELKEVRKIPGIEIAAGVGYRAMVVEYSGKAVIISVTGAPIKQFEKLFEDVQGYELLKGRYPRENRREAVVGYLTATKLFPKEIDIGSFIYINGEKFRVVGIMKEVGNRLDDTSVIIPLEFFEQITGSSGVYDMIVAKVSSKERMDSIIERIKRVLKRIRGVEDFTVMTSRQLLERISAIITGVGIVFLVIGAVSLVVGAIGIMNTMYMSVVEKTKEIGIMKALGATKPQIMLIFLTESSVLGLIGGFVGILIGSAVAMFTEYLAKTSGITVFKSYLGPELYLGSLLFSVLIGIVSGFLPAKRAADMDPVEAIRRM